MKRIILLGLNTEVNIGDVAISECSSRLIEMACGELNLKRYKIVPVDMRGLDYGELLVKEARRAAKEKAREKKRSKALWFRAYRKARNILSGGGYSEELRRRKAERPALLRERRTKMLVRSAAKCAVRCIDRNTAAVIFAGGGLIKFGHQQNLPHLMEPYLRRAEKLSVPVMFSAVGVEGYDGESEECALLRELVNLPCVKSFTCRDDIDLLRDKYIARSDIYTERVPDPVCWAGRFFPCERNDSGIIGIGTARGGLMMDHGRDRDSNATLDIFLQIIAELDRRGMPWKLFSNGVTGDVGMCSRIAGKLGLNAEDISFPAPKSPDELYTTINSFSGVIAFRLHAAIIACAYGIPAVEVVWNVKQRLFGEILGVPERFVDEREFDAAKLVDELDKAVSQGCPEPPDIDRTYAAIKDFLARYVRG